MQLKRKGGTQLSLVDTALARPSTLSPLVVGLSREFELRLANDYIPTVICVMVGALGRNAYSCKNRQPSSQQLKQPRIDFSPITTDLEVLGCRRRFRG